MSQQTPCPCSVAWLTLSLHWLAEESNFSEAGFEQLGTYQVHWVSDSKLVSPESPLSSSGTLHYNTCASSSMKVKFSSLCSACVNFNSRFCFICPTWGHVFTAEEILCFAWAGYLRITPPKNKVTSLERLLIEAVIDTHSLFLYQLHQDINYKCLWFWLWYLWF